MTNAIRGAALTAVQGTITWTPLPYMVEYVEQGTAERRHPKHVSGRQVSLKHFARFATERNVTHLYDIDRLFLIRYVGWVNEQEWTKSYKAQNMKRVRAWLNWLVSCGYMAESPWVNIRISDPTKQPNPLTDDELDNLFHAHRQGAFSMQPFLFHRREMVLCLLLGWGLRIHELVALDLGDLDVRRDFVRCINKGGGAKTLPFLPEMKLAFQRYANLRARRASRDEHALFIARDGRRLSQEEVYKIISELGERIGVHVHPHRLRDTCATTLLDGDVPAERVQLILGHASLKQTLQYAKVNNRKVLESGVDVMDPVLRRLMNSARRTSELAS